MECTIVINYWTKLNIYVLVSNIKDKDTLNWLYDLANIKASVLDIDWGIILPLLYMKYLA